MYIEYSMRGLLTAFFRQKTKFFLVSLIVLAAGLFFLATMPPVYEARGSFLVKLGQGAVPDLSRSKDVDATDVSSSERDAIIESHVKILYSTSLLTDVVKTVGVEKLYPGLTKTAGGDVEALQAAVERTEKLLKATSDSKSNIIEVSITNQDPVVAAQFIGRLMDAFIIRQSEMYSTPQSDFLQQQVADARQQLDQSQKDFQDFKQEVGISSLDEEMAQLIQEKRDLSGIAFKAVTDAQVELAKLQTEEAQQSATYLPDSPIIKRLRDNIAVAKTQLRQRQNDLNAVEDGDKGLSVKIKQINERLAYLDANRTRWDDFKQRVTLNEDNYKYYQQRSEDARVNDMLSQQKITRISVVDKPVVPAKPVPRKRKLMLIAILLTAMLLGLGTALGFELIDERIAYPEQITASLGLPVLASFEEVRGS